MLRSILVGTCLALALLSFTAVAHANSKSELISSFAHLKHGQLYACGDQGSQHSLESHKRWANGQTPNVLKKEILRQIATTYSCLIRKPGLSKESLIKGFAYAKQGTLIALRKTGRQHSIASHSRWAKGQPAQAIRSEIARQLDASYRRVIGQL